MKKILAIIVLAIIPSLAFIFFNGLYVDYGKLPETNNLRQQTISAWIRMVELPVYDGYQIIGNFSDEAGYIFGVSSDGRLLFYQKGIYGAGQWYTEKGSLLPNVLYNVIVTRDSGKPKNVPSLYINGESQIVIIGANQKGKPVDESDCELMAGAVITPELGQSAMFRGDINDIRIYNRILSLEEIQMLVYTGVMRSPEINDYGLVFSSLKYPPGDK